MRKVSLILALALLASACATSRNTPVQCWIDSAGSPADIVREGTFQTGGMEGTFRTWSSASGSYRQETAVGPYREIVIVRAGEAWTRGGEGQPHALAAEELKSAISDAFLANPAAFRAAVVAGAEPNTFVVTPEGGLPLTMRFAANGCAPLSVSRPESDRTSSTTMVSWTKEGARSLPLEMLQSTGDARFDVRLRYTGTRVGGPIEASLFEPAVAERRVALPAGKTFIELPFELTQNHVYVPVSVNGNPPSWFLIDTGADFTIIETSHAKKLGLEATGSLEARGTGGASVETGMIASPRLAFGGIEVPLEAAFAIPLTPIWLREGRAMEGILGYDVLSHFVLEVDYAASKVRLHDPAQFRAPPEAHAVPVIFDSNMPAIETVAELPDGRRIAGRMTLDTGARGALSLNRPFIEQNAILAAVGPTVRGPLGLGVGGATDQEIGRIAALRIGDFALPSVVTSFSLAEKGAHADPNIAGNIGGELLRRFTLWVDYPGQRVLLRPNEAYGQPFEYDMSGLLLEASDTAFERVVVRNVLEGSPAARSGVEVGDEVLNVDGEAVAATTLDAVRAKLAQPERQVVLTVRRSGTEFKVVLTTRRMI